MCARHITSLSAQVHTPLSVDQANYVRDAFAKGVYERLFKWIVNQLNTSLRPVTQSDKCVLGILDIYGFEIFQTNRCLQGVSRKFPE